MSHFADRSVPTDGFVPLLYSHTSSCPTIVAVIICTYCTCILLPVGGIQTPDPGHYVDVIMGAIASQITSHTIVYSTVYSDADQRKHQSSASLAFLRGTGEFPAQMASNAENVSI